MSGGAFDYVCYAVEDDHKILTVTESLIDVEDFLRANSKNEAADEVMKFRVELEKQRDELLSKGHRIFHILFAAEWWASSDIGEDRFDEYWKNWLVGVQNGAN